MPTKVFSASEPKINKAAKRNRAVALFRRGWRNIKSGKDADAVADLEAEGARGDELARRDARGPAGARREVEEAVNAGVAPDDGHVAKVDFPLDPVPNIAPSVNG